MRSDGRTAWIATAGHVIQGSHKIQVTFFGGAAEGFPGSVRYYKPESLDLAVLQVASGRGDLPRFAAENLRTEALAVGERVSFVGHPGDLDWQCYFDTDAVSRLEYLGDQRKFLFSNPRQKRGASGGPVFDQFGNLIGIVLGQHSTGDTFAIGIDAVNRILRDELRLTGGGGTSQKMPDPAQLSPEFKQLEAQLGDLASRANSLNERLNNADRATKGSGGLPARLQKAWQGMNAELDAAEAALKERNIPACEAAIGRSRQHMAMIEQELVK
jgi:S1-C subfamily serine protease